MSCNAQPTRFPRDKHEWPLMAPHFHLSWQNERAIVTSEAGRSLLTPNAAASGVGWALHGKGRDGCSLYLVKPVTNKFMAVWKDKPKKARLG